MSAGPHFAILVNAKTRTFCKDHDSYLTCSLSYIWIDSNQNPWKGVMAKIVLQSEEGMISPLNSCALDRNETTWDKIRYFHNTKPWLVLKYFNPHNTISQFRIQGSWAFCLLWLKPEIPQLTCSAHQVKLGQNLTTWLTTHVPNNMLESSVHAGHRPHSGPDLVVLCLNDGQRVT